MLLRHLRRFVGHKSEPGAWARASAGSPARHQSAKARFTGNNGEASREAKTSNDRLPWQQGEKQRRFYRGGFVFLPPALCPEGFARRVRAFSFPPLPATRGLFFVRKEYAMPLQFVNVRGEVISDAKITLRKAQAHQEAARKKRATPDVKAFHKGWKVTGIPPGALEEARDDHRRVAEMAARSGGRELKPFDEAGWMQNHRGKAVRAKPYETRGAADDCAALAERCGWTRLRIEEVKREVAGA